jgi:hypothetical protein
MNLLKKISENSKKKFKEIKKKININKDYTFDFTIVNKEQKILFLENKEKKLLGDFHFYGIYNNENKLWTWANSIPNTSIDTIRYIEKLRLKSFVFEKMMNNNQSILFFYQLLNNDSMIIPDEKYLGLIIDLLLYLTDDLYIFEPLNSIGNTQIIGLSKINELY